jgi:hypothetical protein
MSYTNIVIYIGPWPGHLYIGARTGLVWLTFTFEFIRRPIPLILSPSSWTFVELTFVRWTTWLQLVERLMEVNLTDDSDSFIWHLTESGVFSVKSFYTDLMNGHTRFLHTYLWKIKVPLKIKIFMWFLHKKVLLTKDNLAKRKWTGCKKM